MRHVVLPLAAVAAVAATLSSSSASFADARTAREIDSGLVIAKSSNKNQVRYALDVDAACAPTGAQPVHAYWRMFERGPDATEPLTAREQRAFGVERQVVDGDDVRVVLRGLPDRAITLRTFRARDGRCACAATTTIEGTRARIASVYVKLSLFGVSYVQLDGVAPTGAALSERLSP